MPNQWRKSPYVVRLNSRRLSTGPSKAKRQAYYDGLTKPLSDAIILALFGNGEQGAYYDPYDLTDEKLDWVAANPSFTSAQFMAQFPNHTLFQDWLGTIPVTGNMQPLGLVLDKRFGGVREAKEFWSANGYAATVVADGSVAQWGIVAGSYTSPDPLSPSTTYELTFTVNVGSGQRIAFLAGGFNSGGLESGTYRRIFTTIATQNNALVIQAATAGVVGTISNISVREIKGRHASQANSAFRMLWQNNNGIKTFYRDGLDDALNVTLPAATYTRIVANTGTGYAANTVVHGGGALNILGSGAGNSAGYILIDRALTPTEAANVETLFNQRAGV